MMLKALIIIHIWSMVIAGCAWVLQRDGKGKVGTSFPAANVWLWLILMSIVPGVLCAIPFDEALVLPKINDLGVFSNQSSIGAAVDPMPFGYLTIYIGLASLLACRTLWSWARLQSLSLSPSTEPDIFTTASKIPPLTLSWPRRAIVIPAELEMHDTLIAHEREHLRNNDAELTLLFLLLRDIMLFNPAISYLVRQWRLAIELRADSAATQGLSISERKGYAALLLNVLRSDDQGARRDALPCPTAHLVSEGYRNAKIRLAGIIERDSNPPKQRWRSALFLSTLGAGLMGLVNSSALATVEVLNADPQSIEYVKQFTPKLPASCPGLTIDDVKYQQTTSTVNGKTLPQHSVKLGLVILKHNVRKDGSTYNSEVLKSTHACFEANAKTAITKWVAEPQEFEVKNAVVKLHFTASADNIDELKRQLGKFLE